MTLQQTSIDPPTLTCTAADAAAALGISRAQFWKLHANGKLGPMPVYLGARAPRWSREELTEWLRAGAPDRQTWLRLKQEGRR
jgi:predicted DNA-binding transcriptional regulator AlpA